MIGDVVDPEPSIELDFVRADGGRWPVKCLIRKSQPGTGHDTVQTLVVLERAERPVISPAALLGGEHFADLFRMAPFGIALISDEGVLAAANPAFARLVNEGRSLPVGEPALPGIMLPQGQAGLDQILQALEAARRGAADIAPIEFAAGQNDEYARRVFVQSLPSSTGSDHPAIVYATDATEERALGQKFAQSQKMEAVGKLAGGIAHDFNNVLTAIIGFSDLLLASHRPSDHAYKNIQNIKSSSNHAASLVKQLLAFSRRQTLEPEVLQLNELVTDLSVILNRLLGENVELKISSGRELWAVKADHNQLNQVIINLAVNARDAMPDGGRLTVRTRNISERESQRLSEQSVVVGQYVMIEVEGYRRRHAAGRHLQDL